MKTILSKIKAAFTHNPLSAFVGKQLLVRDLKVDFVFDENLDSDSIPNLFKLYQPELELESGFFYTRFDDEDIYDQLKAAVSLLFAEIPLHETNISITDVNAYKMGNGEKGALKHYASIDEFYEFALNQNKGKPFPAPFDENIKSLVLNEAQCGITFDKTQIQRFKLFGWSPRLILEAHDGHHRFAHAVALAKHYDLDLQVNAPLEAVVFNEIEFNVFLEMYAQYLIPTEINSDLTNILDDCQVSYISIHLAPIKDVCLLILPRSNLPDSILATFNNNFTDFNEILESYFNIQVNSPIYQRYINGSLLSMAV